MTPTPTDSAMTAAVTADEITNLIDALYLQSKSRVMEGVPFYEAKEVRAALMIRALEADRTKLVADLARVTTAQPYPVSDIEIELMTLREKVASLEADLARVRDELSLYLHGTQDGAVIRDLKGDLARAEGERDALKEKNSAVIREHAKTIQFKLDAERDCTKAEAKLLAAEAKSARLVEALQEIEGMSVPDQPAAFALSRETYLMRWVAKLRAVARAALTLPEPSHEP